MSKCKNCGWYNDGICEFLTDREFDITTHADGNNCCPNWRSLKKEGKLWIDMEPFGDYDLCKGVDCTIRNECKRYQPDARGFHYIFTNCDKQQYFIKKEI